MTRGTLYALTTAHGAYLWKSGAGGGVVAGPAAARGVVYFEGNDHMLHALRLAGRRCCRRHMPTAGLLVMARLRVVVGTCQVRQRLEAGGGLC